MKPSELNDRSPEELIALEQELRERIIRMRMAQATSRRVNTAQFSRIRRDIARIKTIQTLRQMAEK